MQNNKIFKMILFIGIIIILETCTSTYYGRWFVWNFANYEDYKKFPIREIKNTPPKFDFSKDEQPELFKTVSYRYKGTQRIMDFNEILKSTHTTAFIVVRNDTILYEGYFNKYNRNSINTSFSIAKSFTSALIGIAIDDGYIKSVDEPITNYIPELTEEGFKKITIRHLLLMSSGLRYIPGAFPPWRADDGKTYYDPNLRNRALKVKIIEKPETSFLYNNYHPLLLGLILERATNKSVSDYLEEKIWKPLGMEYSASWSIDSKNHGFEKMESGINARVIDFVKFARLFLNKGNWNGKQIISKKWVTESTSPDTSFLSLDDYYPSWMLSSNRYYKYMWWGFKKDSIEYDFYGYGNFGQCIYICPEKQIIIARFGIKQGKVDSWPLIIKDIADKLQ